MTMTLNLNDYHIDIQSIELFGDTRYVSVLSNFGAIIHGK